MGPRQYIADHWNKFDLLVVVVSLVALPFDGPGASLFRLLRLLRVLRLVKFLAGLQLCLTTLMLALPSLLNLMVVLLMVMFIFGVMGVKLFGRVPVDTGGGLTHNVNFSNLYYALVLLFTIATTETWPDVMDDCVSGEHGSWVAVPYFFAYMLLVSCVLLNVVATIVVVQFDTSVDPGRQFFEDLRIKWAFLDRRGTRKVSTSVFCILIRTLPKPIGTAAAYQQQTTLRLSTLGLRRFLPTSLAKLLPGLFLPQEPQPTDPSIFSGDIACLQALADLHVPLSREFTVQYEQVVLCACLKLYECDRHMLTTMARHLDALPRFDKKCFAVHHLWAVRCVERFKLRYSRRSRWSYDWCTLARPRRTSSGSSDAEECGAEEKPLYVGTQRTDCCSSDAGPSGAEEDSNESFSFDGDVIITGLLVDGPGSHAVPYRGPNSTPIRHRSPDITLLPRRSTMVSSDMSHC